MVYEVDEIRQIVAPIAARHSLKAVYLFGSYARRDAKETSDIDLLVDTSGTNIRSLLPLGALYCEFGEALRKKIDLVTVDSLEQPCQMPSEEQFRDAVLRERLSIYTGT